MTLVELVLGTLFIALGLFGILEFNGDTLMRLRSWLLLGLGLTVLLVALLE